MKYLLLIFVPCAAIFLSSCSEKTFKSDLENEQIRGNVREIAKKEYYGRGTAAEVNILETHNREFDEKGMMTKSVREDWRTEWKVEISHEIGEDGRRIKTRSKNFKNGRSFVKTYEYSEDGKKYVIQIVEGEGKEIGSSECELDEAGYLMEQVDKRADGEIEKRKKMLWKDGLLAGMNIFGRDKEEIVRIKYWYEDGLVVKAEYNEPGGDEPKVDEIENVEVDEEGNWTKRYIKRDGKTLQTEVRVILYW